MRLTLRDRGRGRDDFRYACEADEGLAAVVGVGYPRLTTWHYTPPSARTELARAFVREMARCEAN